MLIAPHRAKVERLEREIRERLERLPDCLKETTAYDSACEALDTFVDLRRVGREINCSVRTLFECDDLPLEIMEMNVGTFWILTSRLGDLFSELAVAVEDVLGYEEIEIRRLREECAA